MNGKGGRGLLKKEGKENGKLGDQRKKVQEGGRKE